MDLTTVGGITFAIGMILAGQALEGGHVGSIVQATAAMIVFGGTIGAVMVAFPTKDFVRGLKMAGQAFGDRKHDLAGLTKEIVDLASVARRDGVLALEAKLAEIRDPFLRRALGYAVDGVDASVTRDSLEATMEAEYQEAMVAAKVWEGAGGYAPTIGILGAVLGLIHVMENLSDPSKLGGGIATAFVATVYGVGSANILFLPMANKLKRKIALVREQRVLIAEGVLAIQEGLNPRVLEEKLRAYTGQHGAAKPAQGAKKAA
jgi:chemotaxis protein MotA